MSITISNVLEALKNEEDPDLKKDLVTLGMIKDLEINGKNVNFTVVLTTPACPMKEMIHKACVNAVLHFVDKEANVNVKMTASVTANKNTVPLLPKVKNIISFSCDNTVPARFDCTFIHTHTGVNQGCIEVGLSS